MVGFKLAFRGKDAEHNELDFYDVAQAMIGFQRSLALTTHLIVNGEVITQAPKLKNAKIIVSPPEKGSWEIAALVAAIGGVIYKWGTAPRDTPLGNLIRSGYEYVVLQSLGIEVDYDKTLGQQYRALRGKKDNEIPELEEHRFDSVIEKMRLSYKKYASAHCGFKNSGKCRRN